MNTFRLPYRFASGEPDAEDRRPDAKDVEEAEQILAPHEPRAKYSITPPLRAMNTTIVARTSHPRPLLMAKSCRMELCCVGSATRRGSSRT
jgi:hypothetical protein